MKRLVLFLTLVMFATVQLLQAQAVQISGTVTTSEDGSPLPGVSIVVKGTTVGTLADVEGNYTLTVPQNATTLVFSYVGMKTVEVAIAGRTVVDLVMESDLVGLGDIVVTAIGIKREARALGYSVTEVKSDEIVKSNATDVLNSITGKVAGVRITNSSGAAGASPYITIRGAASITGNNQPLFVVDGVPILSGEGDYGVDGVATSKRTIDLNPEDIESISVLKGGAATALYGVRAATGAILITTKKGQATNKVNVTFSSAVTLSKISQTQPMQKKYTQGVNGTWAEGNRYAWGALVDTMYYYRPPEWSDAPYKWNPDGWLRGINQAGVDPAYLTNEKAKMFDAYDYFQTGVAYNNNLSISGGNDFTTYYFSAGYLNEKGVIPENTFAKTNLKFSADTKLSSKISTGASFNYISSGGNRIQQGSNISGVMLGLVRTSPSFNNAGGYVFPDGTQRNYRGSRSAAGPYDNPYWISNKISYEDKVDRIIGQWNLNYNITDWMNLSYRIGSDFYTTRIVDYFANGSNSYIEGRNEETSQFRQSINSDLLLNFRKDFGDKIKTSLTLGQNMYQYKYKGLTGTANNLVIPDFRQLSNTSVQTTSSGSNLYRTAAVFGDLQIQFLNMLFLDVTGRNDWSTTMPEDNLSDFYPSVSAGFVFTELPFLKNNNILPFGKLRASYAVTANFAGAYQTQSYYAQAGAADGWTTGLTFPFLGSAGYTVGDGLGNSKLKHERQNTIEVGADLRFIQNRFAIDVAYFINQNSDLLLDVPIANSTGFSSLYQNAASMESKGIEILVNVVPVKISGFQWDITANFSKFKNTVKELAPNVENVFLGGFTNPQVRAVADMEYPTLFGYDWWRDDQGRLLLNDDQTSSYYGYPMGNYVMVPLGKVNPDWVLGITNTLSYKGISVMALLEIREGGKMWNGTLGGMRFHGTSGDTESRNEDYVWDGVLGHLGVDGDGNEIAVVSNENPPDIPVKLDEHWYRLGEGSSFTGPTISSIEESSWVRLREITASYSFPEKLFANNFIGSLELYFTGRNLFLSTPFTGIDPETSLLGSSNAQGFDYFNMPGTKSYSFGLRVTF
jgi:TonB-linked SusC/RagA family outer membrane protein